MLTAGVLAFLEALKTNMSSTNTDIAFEALELAKTLLANGLNHNTSLYVVSTLPIILDNLANPKNSVVVAATAAGNAILHKSNSHSVRVITSVLYE